MARGSSSSSTLEAERHWSALTTDVALKAAANVWSERTQSARTRHATMLRLIHLAFKKKIPPDNLGGRLEGPLVQKAQ